MLDRTFKKLGETFDELNREVGDLFAKDSGEQIVGKIAITVKDGCVDIRGPIKELRIDGRLVRFKKV